MRQPLSGARSQRLAGLEPIDHTMKLRKSVNEVYVPLLNERKMAWNDCVHLQGLAAKMRRKIPADDARAGKANHFGGEDAICLFKVTGDGLSRVCLRRNLDRNPELVCIAGG